MITETLRFYIAKKCFFMLQVVFNPSAFGLRYCQ